MKMNVFCFVVISEELPKGVILDFQHVSIADTTTVQVGGEGLGVMDPL